MLKLSGEALEGHGLHGRGTGIDFGVLKKLVDEILVVKKRGVQIAIVIGGGNFWRFRDQKGSGFDRVTSDHMGMLATILNAVAMRSEFLRRGIKARVLSLWHIPQMTQPYLREAALGALADGEIILCAGGTGSPFFTTDTAAALRGLELDCDVLLKATKVDGVYDRDPVKFKNAKRYSELSYHEALEKNLQVMDATSVSLCREGTLPIIVFDVEKKGNLARVAFGSRVGTLIYE